MPTLRATTSREAIVRQPLCADIAAFSLHAAVRLEARDRKRLEKLSRYITRPAPSDGACPMMPTTVVDLRGDDKAAGRRGGDDPARLGLTA